MFLSYARNIELIWWGFDQTKIHGGTELKELQVFGIKEERNEWYARWDHYYWSWN